MSERVLVVAPYPTMPGPEAASSFEAVRALVDEGHDVLIASPRPSAAHVVADPGGLRGAARVARLASGRDRLVLRLDAGALRTDVDPPALLAARAALAGAIRRVGRVELVLDRVPATVAPRWASMIAAPAARIVVSSGPERDALVAAGVARTVVEVDPPPAVASVLRRMGSPAQVPTSASEIEELIRRRARESRSIEAGAVQAVAASRSLRMLEPLERPAVRTRKPGVATVKKIQLRLLAWMFDAVIQHVNRLHSATIDAIDAVDAVERRS